MYSSHSSWLTVQYTPAWKTFAKKSQPQKNNKLSTKMGKDKKHTKNEAGSLRDEKFWLRRALPSSFLYTTFVWPLGDPFEGSQGLQLGCFGLLVEEDGVSWGSEGRLSVRPRARVITSITAARCCNCSLWSLTGRALIFLRSFKCSPPPCCHPSTLSLQILEKKISGPSWKNTNWTLPGLCLNYMCDLLLTSQIIRDKPNKNQAQ